MQSATTHTPKTSYSPACEVTGCIDLNKKLEDAVRERGQQYPEEHAPMFDNPDMRDCALFYLHPFDNYIMGPVLAKGCGCEIRGGGNLISPLHIHHCPLHAAAPEMLETLESCMEDAEMALSGDWDRSDSGFEATRDCCEAVIAKAKGGKP